MTELIILRGLPGCGKSSWARKWVAEDPARRAEVNRDHLRRMMHDSVFLGQDTERQVQAARDAMISVLLKRGTSVVSSDTNLPRRVVRDLAKLAVLARAEWRVEDMTDVPLDTCILRNAEREDKEPVPEQVIRGFHDRFLTGKFQPVTQEEVAGAGEYGVHPYIPDPSLPEAIIVDIDGTVAIHGDRDVYDWTRVHEDRPNEPVIGLVRRLRGAAQGAAWAESSSCPAGTDQCRKVTEDWLDEHVGLPHELHMRKAGDGRADWIVKSELFDEHVRGKYNVTLVLDDRDQVVSLWREMGLTCLQVADGAFLFDLAPSIG